MINVIICTECRDANVTSTVTPGTGISTAMYCPPFYDENGRMRCLVLVRVDQR